MALKYAWQKQAQTVTLADGAKVCLAEWAVTVANRSTVYQAVTLVNGSSVCLEKTVTLAKGASVVYA